MDEPSIGVFDITVEEEKGLENFAEFKKTGSAYALVSATRPSTLTFVLPVVRLLF